jgi:hypothetical protein
VQLYSGLFGGRALRSHAGIILFARYQGDRLLVVLWGCSARSRLRVSVLLPLGRPPPRYFLPGIDRYSISSAGCRLKPQLQDAVHGRSIESLGSRGRFDGRARGNSANTHPKDDQCSPVLRDSEIRALAYWVKSPGYVSQRNTGRPGDVLSRTSVRLNSQQNGACEGRAPRFTHQIPLWPKWVVYPAVSPVRAAPGSPQDPRLPLISRDLTGSLDIPCIYI